MLNIDNQEWWMWQMYRATAEFMQNPTESRKARLVLLMDSYQDFHQQQGSGEPLTGLVAAEPAIVSSNTPS